jgi:glycosyltransferase involved in cell wall biosynthesis
MKLAQVVPSLEAQYGGPSRSVRALSGAFARTGHDTELFTTDPASAATHTEETLRVRTFRRDWPGRICPSAGLRDALRAGDFEVIHHHSIWLRTLHYAHQTAVARDAKFVISPRGMMSRWAWKHRDWRKRLARTFIHPGAFDAAHGWHATSAEEADEIRALGFKQPICVAPNGVEPPDLTASADAASYWRAACPAVSQRPVALFYSRFHQKKRVIELIDLWLEHGPRDWLLLLVGIPQEYSPRELEAYVLRNSGAGRVQAYSGADRPAPYAIASLLLLPSHNENFGLVVAEAMAQGVPALVTDTTPWQGLNQFSRGWCVPWSDYAAALRAATAESPAALRARGLRAKEWVLREYSWEKSARDLAAFYTTLRGPSA